MPFSFSRQEASPSPDGTLLDAHIGPVDYTKQEMTKQEVIKQETVEFTVMDRASGTTTVLCDYFVPVEFSDHMT